MYNFDFRFHRLQGKQFVTSIHQQASTLFGLINHLATWFDRRWSLQAEIRFPFKTTKLDSAFAADKSIVTVLHLRI